MSYDKVFLALLMSLLYYYYIMNLGEAVTFLAIGFVPTLIALELVYRMGRAIGKRGEVSSLVKDNKLKMISA